VLPTPEAASGLATTERSKISPVNQTEREFEEDEAKRVEELKKQMSRPKGKHAPTPVPKGASQLQSFPVN
jgi:hypothetical protein